ncbi:hypothetical protein CEXT_273091 [Caerostris extrusa]|uniref:Uncharacterized protein n=1 Tax=Caerostris extrusa TaxID=172846 RepID=A0AAV4SSM3_CAEEX|nr:hypothetical protein CEXT_273091 [Caerostris extrusa]
MQGNRGIRLQRRGEKCLFRGEHIDVQTSQGDRPGVLDTAGRQDEGCCAKRELWSLLFLRRRPIEAGADGATTEQQLLQIRLFVKKKNH